MKKVFVTHSAYSVMLFKSFPQGLWWSHSAERPQRQQISLLKLALTHQNYLAENL